MTSDRQPRRHADSRSAPRASWRSSRRSTGDLSAEEAAGRSSRPYCLLPVGLGRRQVHHRPGQRGTRRERPHRARTGERAQAGNFVLVQPRRGRVHGRQPEAAGLGGGLADSVPGERRRQPRADGLEHAAPGGAAAARRSAAGGHRHGRRDRARFRRGDRCAGAPAWWIRWTASASSCASRASIARRPDVARGGRRHLPAHQVQALQPEHLHQPEADRGRRASG